MFLFTVGHCSVTFIFSLLFFSSTVLIELKLQSIFVSEIVQEVSSRKYLKKCFVGVSSLSVNETKSHQYHILLSLILVFSWKLIRECISVSIPQIQDSY